MQDLAFAFVQPHEVPMDPPLRLVQVPLGGIPSFRGVSCITQIGVLL